MSLSFLKSRNWLFLWRAHKNKLWLVLAAGIIVIAMRAESKEGVMFMPPKITAPDEEKNHVTSGRNGPHCRRNAVHCVNLLTNLKGEEND